VCFARDSILIAENRLLEIIGRKFEELRSIWDRVGMSEDQRQERMSTAMMHLENLLIEMVQEEQDMLKTVKESVLTLSKSLHALSKELHTELEEVMCFKSVV